MYVCMCTHIGTDTYMGKEICCEDLSHVIVAYGN